MAMRRSVVKGILVTIGGFVGSAFMGLGERAHALTAGGGLGNQWFEDELADTREANSVEVSQILPDIRKRVVDMAGIKQNFLLGLCCRVVLGVSI